MVRLAGLSPRSSFKSSPMTDVTYAIIKLAGKQYRVREGERLLVDRLHEDVRLATMPEVADVVAALRRDHVPVCVSGAGPSLVVFERADRPPITLEALGLPAPWRILRPGIRSRGFEVEIDGDRDGSGEPPLQRGSVG